MTTYVALLRGINVGRSRKVKMDELRKVFERLGHEHVSTYIQSGNVIFHSPKREPTVVRDLEAAIHEQFGIEVSVVLRSVDELAALIDKNPFLSREPDRSRLHVVFLPVAPHARQLKTIDDSAYLPDEFAVVGREVYLRCPNGIGRTKLDANFFNRRIGVAGTARNWNTTTKLLELAGG
jgi:uncharacterized protein (DUF1697 family)